MPKDSSGGEAKMSHLHLLKTRWSSLFLLTGGQLYSYSSISSSKISVKTFSPQNGLKGFFFVNEMFQFPLKCITFIQDRI